MDTSYRKVFIFNKTYVLFVASDILILSATNDRSKNKNKRTNKPTPPYMCKYDFNKKLYF